MKNILLPTDFSANSWNAIEYAIQLFQEEVCSISLLNTYAPIVFNIDHLHRDSAHGDTDNAFNSVSIEKLADWKKRITEKFGENPKHQFQIYSKFDTLISAIEDTVTENKIDLIVMGTQGATGAKEVLFGSNTVHVMDEIKCPILAVPSEFNYEKPFEILFPTDLKVDYTAFQMDIFIQITDMYQSNIHALFVSAEKDLTDKQNSKQLELAKNFKSVSFQLQHFQSKSVTAAIDQFQIDSKINLLVMVNNKHTFFENIFFKSNIHQVGFHIKRPFLVIPSII